MLKKNKNVQSANLYYCKDLIKRPGTYLIFQPLGGAYSIILSD